MGYQRDDNRYGSDDRWRNRERGGRGFGGRDYDRDDRGDFRGRGDEDDRGFFERAGEQIRSWFGDDDDDYRRDQERGRFGREQGYGRRGRPDRDDGRRERFGHRDDDRFSGSGETWAGSGFGGDYDRGRRFDRIDPGSTGTHGAHPMSSPAGTQHEFGYGAAGAIGGNYARDRAIYERDRGSRSARDPHYDQWRSRQIEELDRDYDEYRRENQSQFEREFGTWREKRQGQRQALTRAKQHMEVVGSDGEHLGTVDKLRGDRIILTRNDPNAGGHHHSIPCSWVEKVEDKVVLNKSAAQARQAWTDEDTSRALFERDDSGSDGPHALDRSFSGTY